LEKRFIRNESGGENLREEGRKEPSIPIASIESVGNGKEEEHKVRHKGRPYQENWSRKNSLKRRGGEKERRKRTKSCFVTSKHTTREEKRNTPTFVVIKWEGRFPHMKRPFRKEQTKE